MDDAQTEPAAGQRRERYGGLSWQERDTDRRARITTAAVRLFATRDYSDVTVADVCAVAKVSKRHFYDHFTDRGDLLTAVHTEQNAWLLARLTAAAPEHPANLAELLPPLMQSLVQTLRDHPDRARVIYIDAPRMELRRRGVLREEAEMVGRLVRPLIGPVPDEVYFHRTLLAVVAGISEILIAWVSDGLTAPPGPLAGHLSRLAGTMLAGISEPSAG